MTDIFREVPAAHTLNPEDPGDFWRLYALVTALRSDRNRLEAWGRSNGDAAAEMRRELKIQDEANDILTRDLASAQELLTASLAEVNRLRKQLAHDRSRLAPLVEAGKAFGRIVTGQDDVTADEKADRRDAFLAALASLEGAEK